MSRISWFSLADFGAYLPMKSNSGPMLDEINRVLAAHYGFTAEQLDFIPSTSLRAGNYDIKYRMGREEEIAEESPNG